MVTNILLSKKKSYKKQLAVVRDALAAYIAKILLLRIESRLFRMNKKISGKIKTLDWPATFILLLLVKR